MSWLKLLGDNRDPSSLATRMRRRRFAFFLTLLDTIKGPVKILDVGGTQDFWMMMGAAGLDDADITLLNLAHQPVSARHFTSVAGDARDLSRYGDGSFDVVFSNSVIEHLGPGFRDQQKMADEISRVGKRYFVQTPNRYFPIEPHFLTPGFQFLPIRLRAWIISRTGLGWYDRIPERSEARREVESIELLTERQVRELFPRANIYKERFLGITKSFVAYYGWNLEQWSRS